MSGAIATGLPGPVLPAGAPGVLHRLARTPSARAGLMLLLPMILLALFAPLIAQLLPHHFSQTDLAHRYAPPEPDHPLGTDGLGRDVLSRLLEASRASVAVGLLATALAGLIALCVGSLAGYYGGWTDSLLSRLIEVVISFPALFLILALLGTDPPLLRRLSDLSRITMVVGLTGWTAMARHLRAEFLQVRELDFVQAARASGAGNMRIMARHILPNALGSVLVSATFFVAQAMLLEAAVSFLGFGIQPPEPSWGSMLGEAQEAVAEGWWLALFPGGALFLAVLGCNLAGEGLRQALDPRAALDQTPSR